MNLHEAYKIINRHHKARRSLTGIIDSRNSGDNRTAAPACLSVCLKNFNATVSSIQVGSRIQVALCFGRDGHYFSSYTKSRD